MFRTRRLAALLGIAATTALGLVAPPMATLASATSADWVSVNQVLVNRLGGVSVSGQVSCAATYERIAAGSVQYQDDQGNWYPIELQPGDKVNLAANTDNYTVTQPSGRKAMIQVTHGSSRMNPCFLQYPFSPDGSPMPDWVQCAPEGAPCGWQTDEFGYDHDSLPPLFDYSPHGKFKAGLLSVRDQSIGLLVMVAHFSGDTLTGWDDYFVPEGSYSTVSTTLKAVNYRG
ncbi:MAG TPA: hypothetical protein VFJ17_15310 [Mycobacteriales bacterium]|nr:hypothetical protein [Mycobacteriales bacterium]